MKILPILVFIIGLASTTAFCGEADVIDVDIDATGSTTYTFSVSVRHADQGWKHYADRWEVLAPDGRVLATRTLYHPHVDEQPFTRSLSGVKIPKQIEQVIVLAHCSVHAYGGKKITVTVPRN